MNINEIMYFFYFVVPSTVNHRYTVFTHLETRELAVLPALQSSTRQSDSVRIIENKIEIFPGC